MSDMSERMRSDFNLEKVAAGGGVGLKPREGEDGRDDVTSLMQVLRGKSSNKNTIPRLFKNGSVPKSFRGISGTDEEVVRFRTQVLEIMEELDKASSKVGPDDRKREDNAEWKQIQSRVADIGLDADAWAVAFDLVREQEAKDAAVVAASPDAKAGVTKTEREDGLVDPVDVYYKERLLNDLNCVLTRDRGFDEARKRLLSVDIKFDKITGVGRDERESRKIRDTRNALRDVVSDLIQIVDNPTRAEEVRVGYVPELEHLVGLDKERFLRVRGLQKTAEETLEAAEGEENTPEDEVKRILVANTVDNQILNSVRSDLSRFIRSHDGDLKYTNAVEKAKRILLDLQERRHSQNAYKLTDEEMTKYGIEKPSNRDDLLLRTISKPILGHEILDDMTGGFLFRGEKRRAYEKEEVFSYAEIAEMLAEKYSELLESFNGQITNKSDVNPNWLGLVDERLRKRRDDLRKMIRTASGGEKGKIFFPSLLHSEKDVELGLDVLRQKIMDSGYPLLTSDERKKIPEVMALGEVEALLAWNDAQTELIRSLQTIRNYGNAKKVEGVAGLGENPDRLIMKTSSFRRLCRLRGLGYGEELADMKEEDTIADMTDKSLRIYGLIAGVSAEMPGKETGDPVDLFIKKLARDFLTEKDEVLAGSDVRAKDVRFVLNRFGLPLKPVQQAKVEAFIRTLVSEKLYVRYAGAAVASNKAELERDIRSKLSEEIKVSIETAMKGASIDAEGPEVVSLTRKQKELSVALNNSVALAHVTGLADTWSAFYEYKDPTPGKDHPSMETTAYFGRSMVGQLKVGGYPACTAGAEVANYRSKLLAELHEGKWSGTNVLRDALENNELPPYLAGNYFRTTVINREGVATTLWTDWQTSRMSLRKIAEEMSGVSEEAIQGYFNSLSSASKLAEYLKGKGTKLLAEVFEDNTAQGKIDAAITYGFGMPVGPEKVEAVANLKAIIYANAIYELGLTRQLQGADILKAVEDTSFGSPVDSKLGDYLRRIIKDHLSISPVVSSLRGGVVRIADTTKLPYSYYLSRPVPGAMDLLSMKKFVGKINQYYLLSRRRSLIEEDAPTLKQILNVVASGKKSVLIDIEKRPAVEEILPYASIWRYLSS